MSGLSNKQRRLQSIVLEFVSRKLFSGAVLVHRRYQPLLQAAYGYADLEQRRVNRPQTIFNIGSMTKSFTATATLIASERGHLRLTDPVSRYLPELPRGDEIRIEHLLSNTAGLPDYLNLPIFVDRQHLSTPRSALIESFRNEPLQFQPGSEFAYSNSNWIVLAEILSRATGMDYAAFLDAAIFGPLGMRRTGYARGAPPPGAARGHARRDGRLEPSDTIHPSLLDGAGALHSSIHDLLTFDWALGSSALLKPETIDLMETPYVTPRERAASAALGRPAYGFGWFVDSLHGRRCVRHEGGLFGFVAGLYRFPEEEAAVIVLSNVMDAPLDLVSRALAAELFDESYDLHLDRDAGALALGEFAPYAGTYAGSFLNRPFKMKLEERAGQCYLNLIGWNEFEIQRTGERSFFAFAKGGELEATFREGPGGRFDAIDMLWAGTAVTVRRCAAVDS